MDKYSNVSLGLIEEVFDKLGGIDGVNEFLTGKKVVAKPNQSFETLASIKVGVQNLDSVIASIMNDKKVDRDADTDKILSWPPIADCHTEEIIELVSVPVKDLGFEGMFETCATYANICTAAEKFGLIICPSEVPFLLCLPENRIPLDTFYFVATKPLRTKAGIEFMLSPWYSSKKIELKAWGYLNSRVFNKEFKFIFMRKKAKI